MQLTNIVSNQSNTDMTSLFSVVCIVLACNVGVGFDCVSLYEMNVEGDYGLWSAGRKKQTSETFTNESFLPAYSNFLNPSISGY